MTRAGSSRRARISTATCSCGSRKNARRNYLDAIRNYWSSYDDVRRATLYDFELGEELQAPAVDF